jgi:hypothetical protein
VPKYDEPENMTPDEIREEIAELLARGFLRTFIRRERVQSEADNSSNADPSTENGLDLAGTRSVNAPRG